MIPTYLWRLTRHTNTPCLIILLRLARWPDPTLRFLASEQAISLPPVPEFGHKFNMAERPGSQTRKDWAMLPMRTRMRMHTCTRLRTHTQPRRPTGKRNWLPLRSSLPQCRNPSQPRRLSPRQLPPLEKTKSGGLQRSNASSGANRRVYSFWALKSAPFYLLSVLFIKETSINTQLV